MSDSTTPDSGVHEEPMTDQSDRHDVGDAPEVVEVPGVSPRLEVEVPTDELMDASGPISADDLATVEVEMPLPAGDEPPPPGGPGWDALEGVLDSYEERRAKELADRREAEAVEAEFKSGCVCVLRDLVLPTFEEAGRSLARRAHECVVTKRISDYDVPSADLTIRPYVPGERWVRRSRLSMRCVSTEGFVVFGEIQPPQKEPISMSLTQPLAEVNEAWIKRQVLQFVRSVLAEY